MSSVCLSSFLVFPSACLPLCLPACLPACLPVCLSASLPACLPACLPYPPPNKMSAPHRNVGGRALIAGTTRVTQLRRANNCVGRTSWMPKSSRLHGCKLVLPTNSFPEFSATFIQKFGRWGGGGVGGGRQQSSNKGDVR
jgi:hypothetical protein